MGKSNQWSEEAHRRLSNARKAQGYSDSAKAGLAAAMALPDGQRGPQHRDAKLWVLISPDGQEHYVINLKDWARKHAEWFDFVQDDTDRDRVAHNIRTGIGQIVRSMKQQRKHPVYTYKGWQLGDWPREK